MIYLDTSALVKRYIDEEGSDQVHALLENRSLAACSRLAYTEVLSALQRRHKAGDLPAASLERIRSAFKADWAGFVIVELHLAIFQLAEKVIERHALRGADSLHLASALWLRETVKEPILFAAADRDLLKAAAAENLTIFNPQAPP